jgi:hypothetical protein
MTHAQVRQQKMSRNFQVHQVGQAHREEEMDSNVGWLLVYFFYSDNCAGTSHARML